MEQNKPLDPTAIRLLRTQAVMLVADFFFNQIKEFFWFFLGQHEWLVFALSGCYNDLSHMDFKSIF